MRTFKLTIIIKTFAENFIPVFNSDNLVSHIKGLLIDSCRLAVPHTQVEELTPPDEFLDKVSEQTTVIETIVEYIEAKAELDKAKLSCESSRGYWLHDLIEEVARLGKKAEAEIKEIVRRQA